jgi:hypothetical protein
MAVPEIKIKTEDNTLIIGAPYEYKGTEPLESKVCAEENEFYGL